MTPRELLQTLRDAWEREHPTPDEPAATFQPSADDCLAADLASRFGIVVWIQPTSHGLLWALHAPPLQRCTRRRCSGTENYSEIITSMADYDHMREIPELRECIGSRLVDITDTDRDEREQGEADEMCLHFDNGTTIRVPITALGFDVDP